jgi:acyl-CoA synthetase (AMP-forming)/AMP-acid ligase II
MLVAVGARASFATDLESWGDRPALITEAGRTVSYAELAGLADAFAARLGDRVKLAAVEMRNALEPIVALLGCLRAGVPVIVHADGAATANVLANCPPDAAYGFDEARGGWTLNVDPKPWEAPPCAGLAILLSTSGSTGSAKLVRLSGANLQANAASIASYLELTDAERAITTLPLSYSYGLSILNSHLDAGAALVLTDESVSTPAFRALVEREGVTSLAGVPHSYELMERSGLLAKLPGSVRTLTQAGGRMAPEMVETVMRRAREHGARLFVMYGQTEASPRIAYLPPEELEQHLGCIGRAIPGGELWVEDGEGRRQPLGAEGELIYRGPNVMMGYASSRADLAGPAGGDLLRTGDLAVEVEPGLFRITGRSSRFVKPFGLRVSLDELETRCREAGAAAYIAGSDEVVAVASEPADAPKVRETVEALGMPEDLFVFLEFATIPRLPGGKPDYPEILRLARARRAAETEVGGLPAVEALFKRLARGEMVTPQTSFEGLGGDSLSYVQCSIAIEAALGHIPDAWERLTLEELRGLQRASSKATPGLRWMTLESDIVVRALAIMQVLFQHGLAGFGGGADILMVLAGYSWARFQRPRLLRGDGKGALIDFARRYLIVYFGVMMAVLALNHRFLPEHYLFYSTFVASWGGILNTYWFIEALTWCVVLTCGTLAIPAVRSFFRAQPLSSGLAFVAAAVAIRLLGAAALDPHTTFHRTPDQMLLYFATGWAVALSGKGLRAALFALIVGASLAAWGWRDPHAYAMGIAGLMIVAMPRMRLPRVVGQAATLVAAASFYIYLLNPIPMYLTDQVLHAPFGRYWWLQIVLSLALGIGAYFGIQGMASRGDQDPDRPRFRWSRLNRMRKGLSSKT